MNAQQQWQDVKEGYLRQIEKSLARTDHPRRAEILSDVKEHLERKYAELPAEEHNWEAYQRIVTEMGPPEDYAELLTEERTAQKSRFGINEVLAIIFVATLIAIGGYLVYTAKTTPNKDTPVQPPAPLAFEADERVLGKWHSIDFVKRIEDFDPNKRNWSGSLYLKALEFVDQGVVWWFIDEDKYQSLWTKGKVQPDAKRPALYQIRNIDGNDYLFYEWLSGDVTEQGMEPWFYVLVKKE